MQNGLQLLQAMLLGYSGAAIVRPFLEIDLFAVLLEALVLVPAREAFLEGRVLFTAGGHHQDAAGLAALSKIGHFLGAELIPSPVAHNLWNQNLSFHLAQRCVVWISCRLEF